jgi:hypothetical protein
MNKVAPWGGKLQIVGERGPADFREGQWEIGDEKHGRRLC